MKAENKKGQYSVGMLGGLAITLVVAAIIIAIGSQVLDDVGEKFKTSNTSAGYSVSYNATQNGLEGTSVFGEWLDTIALIIVAAVVIGIIASSFGRSQ